MKALALIALTFINNTGTTARLVTLSNACEGNLLKSEVVLKPHETVTVKAKPVMQFYNVCAAGLCSASVIAVIPGRDYKLNLILDEGLIDVKATPDDWPNSNQECPK